MKKAPDSLGLNKLFSFIRSNRKHLGGVIYITGFLGIAAIGTLKLSQFVVNDPTNQTPERFYEIRKFYERGWITREKVNELMMLSPEAFKEEVDRMQDDFAYRIVKD